MRVCGGAAFRKELGIERRFRDARAARVMAPTTDALYDFVGRAITGLPLLEAGWARPLIMGAVAYDPKVVTIWEGFRRWFDGQDLAFDFVLYSNYERQVADLVERPDRRGLELAAGVGARPAPGAAPRGDARALTMRDTDRDLTSVVVVRAGSPIDDAGGLRAGDRRHRRRRLAAGDADPAVAPARTGPRAGSATSPCGASTSASACTATTSAGSGTRPGPSSPARSTPPA